MGGKSSKPKQNNDSNQHEANETPPYDGPPLGEAWDKSVSLPPSELVELINQYHADHFDVRRYSLDHCKAFTLFGRSAEPAFYALKIAPSPHVLYGRRTQAIEVATEHPESMMCVTQARDPFGRWVEGTPLGHAAGAGDPYLVQQFIKLLPKKEAEVQLRARFPMGWEDETKDRMERYYLTPLREFASQLEKAKLSTKGISMFNDAQAECKEIIHKYRVAIRHKPDDPIIRIGLDFDPKVLEIAYRFIIDQIDYCSPIEADLLFKIGYQSLFGVSNAFIMQTVETGAVEYLENQTLPEENLKFHNGSPFYSENPDEGIGGTFIVSYLGRMCGISQSTALMQGWMKGKKGQWGPYVEQAHQYCSAENIEKYIDTVHGVDKSTPNKP